MFLSWTKKSKWNLFKYISPDVATKQTPTFYNQGSLLLYNQLIATIYYVPTVFCEYKCCGSDSIESACSQCRRPGFHPWVEKIPGVGNGNQLQYSCLENFMDRGAWRAQFTGSQRVRNDWVTNTFTLMCAVLILWGKNRIWKTAI